jgi:hypothetical protein
MLKFPCGRHEGLWEMEVQPHASVAWALEGSEWPDSRLGRFIPKEKFLTTLWIKDRVGPLASL